MPTLPERNGPVNPARRCPQCHGLLESYGGQVYCPDCWTVTVAALPDDPPDLVRIEDDPLPADDSFMDVDDAGRGTW
jgi:hypothetical protein